MTFFLFKEIINFLLSIAIYFILAYYKTYRIIILTSDFLLPIIVLVDKNILLIVNISFSVIFIHIFLIWANKSLISLSSSII